MPITITDNPTKRIGVGYIKAEKMWRASIRLHGKQVSLGSFRTEAKAIIARMGGELVYFGEVTTEPTPETQGFYDTMMEADDPYWFATAAMRAKPISHENSVRFNKDRWVSYEAQDHELTVLGTFKTYMEAYTRSQLEKSNLYQKED